MRAFRHGGGFWLEAGPVSFSSGRTHHPECPFGAWKLCRNGIQLFAGRFALTIHWPARLTA
jgi:hypothetical protein